MTRNQMLFITHIVLHFNGIEETSKLKRKISMGYSMSSWRGEISYHAVS